MPPRQPSRPGRHRGQSSEPTFREQRTAARAQARTRARATLAKRAAGVTPEGAAVAAADVGARAARSAGRARLPTGNRQYQGVILAEFLVAVLIVSLAPLARGKAAQDKSGGPSPYGVDDIKQLAGIGATYFVLALLSSGKWGRLSAWLGGLILVAIGLAQTQTGGLQGVFGIFQPSGLSAGPPGLPAAAAAGSPATGPAAVPDATGIFPVITPGGQVIPAGVAEPTPTGAPTFTQQVTTAQGGLVQSYTGGPGTVTTNTGTGLA